MGEKDRTALLIGGEVAEMGRGRSKGVFSLLERSFTNCVAKEDDLSNF
jgi:hypothetical protein